MALLDSRPCRYCARIHPVLLPFRHDVRVVPGLSVITKPFQFWRAADLDVLDDDEDSGSCTVLSSSWLMCCPVDVGVGF